jgi:ferredoxin
MATYKVTLINANEGLNRTIACADNQSIFAAAADPGCRSSGVLQG